MNFKTREREDAEEGLRSRVLIVESLVAQSPRKLGRVGTLVSR